MQERNPEIGKIQRNKLSRQLILDCFESKRIKVVDLTDVLAKFPEIFSISVFDPECKKPSEMDPNEALIPQPINGQTKKILSAATIVKPKLVIAKSPFSKSGYTEGLSLRVWYYIDEQENVQGPFTSIEMDNWFDQGYFFNELLIRFKNNQFYELIELFGKLSTPPSTSSQGAERKHSKETQAEVIIKRSSLTQEASGLKPGLPAMLKSLQAGDQESLERAGVKETANSQQKGGSKRGSKRMSVEEAPIMTQKNIWENFIDKNKVVEPKVETAITNGSGSSVQKPETKQQPETNSIENSDVKLNYQNTRNSDNKDDPKITKKEDNKSFEASESDSAKKNNKKKSEKRRKSDSDSGNCTEKKKYPQQSQKPKKKNSREYIEYLPKDDTNRSEKEQQETKNSDWKEAKEPKKDNIKQQVKQGEENKQKKPRGEGKNKRENSGQNYEGNQIESLNNTDSKQKGDQNQKGKNEQLKKQQEASIKNQSSNQTRDHSDSLPSRHQNEQKPQQNRNQKRNSHAKYFVVFEPKVVLQSEEQKFYQNSVVEEKQKPILPNLEDCQVRADSMTYDKSNNSVENGDSESLLATMSLMRIEDKGFIENGKAFLPKPVTHSRFEKIFKENARSLQAAQ